MKLIRIALAISHSLAYYRGVLRGISHYAEMKPQWLITSMVLEEPSLQLLRHFRPVGLIASVNSKPLLKTLASWRRPVVNVSAVLPGLRLARVGVDNAGVGRLAAAHFLDRGLRHFGFIGPPDYIYSTEREVAFRVALSESGHSLDSYYSPSQSPFDPLDLRWSFDQGVLRWLRDLPKPVGVLAPSDAWGVQLAEACRIVSVQVPNDIAILGVDDDDLNCELSRPRLSSVIVPAERIGYEAAALLDRLLSGQKRPARPILIPSPGVATRQSTDVLAIDDREVIEAVRFIRDHAHLPLRVADILKLVPVGRRTLERRFHAALGWGLGEEIRRAHLEVARRLLGRTSLPIKTVAKQAGFSGFRHMAVVFRQEHGLSPSAYRHEVSRSIAGRPIHA